MLVHEWSNSESFLGIVGLMGLQDYGVGQQIFGVGSKFGVDPKFGDSPNFSMGLKFDGCLKIYKLESFLGFYKLK